MKYVAYYRVSTTKQGKSGLGLEAQRETVRRFTQGAEIIAHYQDTESGRKDARLGLHKAIAHAKAEGATLLVAKLDRLSRDVRFIFTLRDTGVNFVCCDLPDCNTLTLGIFAAFAQHEHERISQRQRDTWQAKRDRKDMSHFEAVTKNLLSDPTIVTKSIAVRKLNALEHSANRQAAELVATYHSKGLSLRAIAKKLNDLSLKTRRGKLFTAMQVKRLIERNTVQQH